jgi:2-polyprenyl-3-methyl-5-hydroxy-6-metoxy-1,4-benzoquinol methylase
MDELSDEKIRDSWGKNGAAWTSAIRNREIESRKLVTDRAIIETIMDHSPKSVLDVGCGEGWLARELNGRGVRVSGLDVVPDLVEEARRCGGGEFFVASYEDIIDGLSINKVDTVVCNFSLIGKESVEGVVRAVPRLLNPPGTFIVQTPHPISACGSLPYEDGWRKGSWDGFSSQFVDPAPWYFRTVESWEHLLESAGLRVIEKREPTLPSAQKYASIIFVLGVGAS